MLLFPTTKLAKWYAAACASSLGGMCETLMRGGDESSTEIWMGVTESAGQRAGHGVTLEISQTQGVWFGANKMFRRGATMDTARLSTVLSGRIIFVTMTSHFVAG